MSDTEGIILELNQSELLDIQKESLTASSPEIELMDQTNFIPLSTSTPKREKKSSALSSTWLSAMIEEKQLKNERHEFNHGEKWHSRPTKSLSNFKHREKLFSSSHFSKTRPSEKRENIQFGNLEFKPERKTFLRPTNSLSTIQHKQNQFSSARRKINFSNIHPSERQEYKLFHHHHEFKHERHPFSKQTNKFSNLPHRQRYFSSSQIHSTSRFGSSKPNKQITYNGRFVLILFEGKIVEIRRH